MFREPLPALEYAQRRQAAFVAELKEFIRFPSISAQPTRAKDIADCAHWLARRLRSVGLHNIHVMGTTGYPIVYAERLEHPRLPTVLLYGHYDVQPPDPLEEWISPPFEPTLRGRDLYGRGACDDKGQLLTHINAMEAYLRTGRALPVNVKCLYEGEEEIGSPHLAPFIERHRDLLRADLVLMSDTRMLAADRPAITYAERGSLYLELEIRGPKHDLHSGNFGGIVHNPLQVLCELLAGLHAGDGTIAVPGVYERVRQWSARERESMAMNGPSDSEMLQAAEVRRGWGEPGYTLYERVALRPALTINGVSGGYQGRGPKGVIPARASAKLSFRLVPDQEPAGIARLFREHIRRVAPPSVRTSIRMLSGALPVLIDPRSPAIRAAAFAYSKGFGALPTPLRSGGTIPILSTFQRVLGLTPVLMGFALPDDRIHAPNEKFHLPNFFKGIATSIWFLASLAAHRGRLA